MASAAASSEEIYILIRPPARSPRAQPLPLPPSVGTVTNFFRRFVVRSENLFREGDGVSAFSARASSVAAGERERAGEGAITAEQESWKSFYPRRRRHRSCRSKSEATTTKKGEKGRQQWVSLLATGARHNNRPFVCQSDHRRAGGTWCKTTFIVDSAPSSHQDLFWRSAGESSCEEGTLPVSKT